MTSPADRHDSSPKEAERTGVTIVSLFRSHSEAEAAIRELKSAGAEYFERGLRGGGILLPERRLARV